MNPTSVQRRPLQFDCLRDSVTEIRRLNESGYTKAGNWDLGQMCQHLSKTTRIAIEGAPFNLPFFLKPIARWLLSDKIMKGQPTGLPLITVREFQPESNPDAGEAIDEYEALVNQVLDEKTKLLPQHPVFGKFEEHQWKKFFAWHAAHHLSYLIPHQTPTAQPGPTSPSTSTPTQALEA